jgi:PKD repeat protein
MVYYPNVGSFNVSLVATNCAGTNTLVKTAYIHVDSVIHPISAGISSDFLDIIIRPHTAILSGGSSGDIYNIYYYKPLHYDPLTSPILFGIHGLGGNGNGTIGTLQAIADRRNALIVAPTMHVDWCYVNDMLYDSISGCYQVLWLTEEFKQIYRHVLQRENRDSIPSYLIGFSAGGQFTTRYMLVRQFDPDSIPLRMAVSGDPSNYTLCTDTFNNAEMPWDPYRCGLAGRQTLISNCALVDTPLVKDFICDAHVIQYYNENYGVLIGTADTETFSGFCPFAQGTNRYDRTKKFYSFSDSDAVVRGTTLKWQYGEVPGVGHDMYAIFNTVLAGDSMPLAERLLFETHYHTVPNLAPHANFNTNTTVVTLPSATVQFNNSSINATTFLWDFGDSTTSTLTNPSHTYTYTDTFTVSLTAFDSTGCENKIIKWNYIIVNNTVKIKENNLSNCISIYPNPVTDNLQIQTTLPIKVIAITDITGRLLYTTTAKTINCSRFAKGVYFITLTTDEGKTVKKFVKD